MPPLVSTTHIYWISAAVQLQAWLTSSIIFWLLRDIYLIWRCIVDIWERKTVKIWLSCVSKDLVWWCLLLLYFSFFIQVGFKKNNFLPSSISTFWIPNYNLYSWISQVKFDWCLVYSYVHASAVVQMRDEASVHEQAEHGADSAVSGLPFICVMSPI